MARLEDEREQEVRESERLYKGSSLQSRACMSVQIGIGIGKGKREPMPCQFGFFFSDPPKSNKILPLPNPNGTEMTFVIL